MRSEDHTAAVAAVPTDGPNDDDDPHVVAHVPVAALHGDPTPWPAGDVDAVPATDDLVDPATRALLLDGTLDRRTAARLRDESRRTRDRVEARLRTAGHAPGAVRGDRSTSAAGPAGARPGGPPAGGARAGDAPGAGHPVGAGAADRPAGIPADAIDGARDLSGLVDDNAALLEHIDALHERRTTSLSSRERQVATRTLAEALYRIVDGYRVDVDPAPPSVEAFRRADLWIGEACNRVAVIGRSPAGPPRWWGGDGRWVRLGLALVACAAAATQLLVVAAVAVTVRAVLSALFHTPAPAVGTRRRILGYSPDWASCLCTHVGDAAILIGTGLALQLRGATAWGAVTVFAALYGLLTTMVRVATGQQGFRLERLRWDRATRTVVLPLAVTGVALAGPTTTAAGTDAGAGVLAVAVAVVAVVAVGTTEIARTLYYALRRRRLFRRAGAAEPGPVPDVIVAHTRDAVVMNITREGRPGVVPEPDRARGGDGARHLRAVGDGTGTAAPARGIRRARRGR